MNVQFERREQIGPDVWQYYFTPERPLDYEPGQYVEVRLLEHVNDSRGPSRTFTLTSLPSDNTISFAVKCSTLLSPYKQVLQTMQPGINLHVGDAMGDVVLPKSPFTPLLFIAGGLGVASYISILRSLKRSGQKRDIQLLYALRRPEDKLYASLLDTFLFTATHDFVSPARLSVADISTAINEDSLLYLSGSQRFVEGLHAQLEASGIDRQRIIFDFFDGYAEL